MNDSILLEALTSENRRALILVSKVLQNCANNVQFRTKRDRVSLDKFQKYY